ncbi:hypothetical protein ACVRXF_09915 [Streptococcus orisasini]
MIVKEKVINKVLSDKNLSLKVIVDKLSQVTENSGILLYTSFLEGLGNKNSDIDIYVFLEDNQNFNNQGMRRYGDCLGVEVVRVGDIELDIEYWSINVIEDLIERLTITNGLACSYEELKLLLRIYHGFFTNQNKVSERLLYLIKTSHFLELITNRISLEARSYCDDSLKMFEVGEYILALDCARRALWECASLLNAKNGKPNLKSKWISKIYINNGGYGDQELLERYMNLQIYSTVNKQNLKSVLQNMLSLIQDMLNSTVF